ncbi:hypothetical protein EZV62_014463 [Acer yangbiense]|uniref:AMP-dependent synthetase/ligase domain-containing protein n=1 Tax=Acer yangbiense TaxID=1000413 RepID=A0A5C7HSB7_9ROSI|nr:hypothetical protein EZV62_014463 [Acer yangbiense]
MHAWLFFSGYFRYIPNRQGLPDCIDSFQLSNDDHSTSSFIDKNHHGPLFDDNVTHMSGAPTILNMIVNSPVSDQKPLPHKVDVMTGGAPPPPQILLKTEEFGFRVSHLYGLTETHGPGTYCTWKPEWDALPLEERSRMKARQGMQHIALEEVDIKDPITMESVPADGKTMGEIMFRGNTVMSGYLKDLEATEEAFCGGWFQSGDLAVKHPDGYKKFLRLQLLRGQIITGDKTPCAFVKLKEGFDVEKICQELQPERCRNLY